MSHASNPSPHIFRNDLTTSALSEQGMGMLAAGGAAGPLPFCWDISIGFIARGWDVKS
jgi:hypothetical protein